MASWAAWVFGTDSTSTTPISSPPNSLLSGTSAFDNPSTTNVRQATSSDQVDQVEEQQQGQLSFSNLIPITPSASLPPPPSNSRTDDNPVDNTTDEPLTFFGFQPWSLLSTSPTSLFSSSQPVEEGSSAMTSGSLSPPILTSSPDSTLPGNHSSRRGSSDSDNGGSLPAVKNHTRSNGPIPSALEGANSNTVEKEKEWSGDSSSIQQELDCPPPIMMPQDQRPTKSIPLSTTMKATKSTSSSFSRKAGNGSGRGSGIPAGVGWTALRQRLGLRSVVKAMEQAVANSRRRMFVDENDTSAVDSTAKSTKPPKIKIPRPPRPTISKTRLKIFVGTWNMMGQMPELHDGLDGLVGLEDLQLPSALGDINGQRDGGYQVKPANMYHRDSNLPTNGMTKDAVPMDHHSNGRQESKASAGLKKVHFKRKPLSTSTEDRGLSSGSGKEKKDLLRRKLSGQKSGGQNKDSKKPSAAVAATSPNTEPSILGSATTSSPKFAATTAAGGQRSPLLFANDPFLEMNNRGPYHIIVINTQECEREIREAVIFPSKVAWEKQIQASLGRDYVMIKTETMAALHIAVLVWKPIERLVHAVDSSTVATGMGGILGNKGAVAVSLYLGSMSLLFVNAHLTAHQSNVAARNSDYKRIVQELRLNDAPKEVLKGWHFQGDAHLRRVYDVKGTGESSPSLASPTSVTATRPGTPVISTTAEPASGAANATLATTSPVLAGVTAGQNQRVHHQQTGLLSFPASSHATSTTNSSTTSLNLTNTATNAPALTSSPQPEMPSHPSPTPAPPTKKHFDITEQFDYTFWAGDLNYRVELTRAKADECLLKNDIETMLNHDQLSIQRKAGEAFQGFLEAPITFRPTYKYDPMVHSSTSTVSISAAAVTAQKARAMKHNRSFSVFQEPHSHVPTLTVKSGDRHHSPLSPSDPASANVFLSPLPVRQKMILLQEENRAESFKGSGRFRSNSVAGIVSPMLAAKDETTLGVEAAHATTGLITGTGATLNLGSISGTAEGTHKSLNHARSSPMLSMSPPPKLTNEFGYFNDEDDDDENEARRVKAENRPKLEHQLHSSEKLISLKDALGPTLADENFVIDGKGEGSQPLKLTNFLIPSLSSSPTSDSTEGTFVIQPLLGKSRVITESQHEALERLNQNYLLQATHSRTLTENRTRREMQRLEMAAFAIYDTSNKKRVPSWTDRILWKVAGGGNKYLPVEIGDDTRAGGNGVGGQGIGHEHHHTQQQQQDEVEKSRNADVVPTNETTIGKEKIGLFGAMSEKMKMNTEDEESDNDEMLMAADDVAKEAVLVKEYRSRPEVGLFSDHRPVTGVFAVKFDWDLVLGEQSSMVQLSEALGDIATNNRPGRQQTSRGMSSGGLLSPQKSPGWKNIFGRKT